MKGCEQGRGPVEDDLSPRPDRGEGGTRVESDLLGPVEVPAEAYYGAHTVRSLENFPLSGRKLRGVFVKSLAQVKLACARTNVRLGCLEREKGEAVAMACQEMIQSDLGRWVVVDAFQGGAGTSTNMNVNEVLANRANELLGGKKGDYSLVHPLDDVNLHQSTNDVFPTALKVAALHELKDLESGISRLQERFQVKEHEFGDLLKVGRTELVDAAPMTLGMEFGAFAEAIARDRWRVFKCRERLKTVNLGGTALGGGHGAPQKYIFQVVDELRRITGLPLSRAENLVDATQNLDCLVEASGMLKAYASNLLKIANDLRLLSGGPDAGLGEIELAPLQAGSSIMAGKINPVAPEAVAQVAIKVMANDCSLSLAVSLGQLELNHLAPLIAHDLLESLGLLVNATRMFSEKCVALVKARPERCQELLDKSMTLGAVLAPVLGYARVEELIKKARAEGTTLAEAAASEGICDLERMREILSPARTRKLGYAREDFKGIGRIGGGNGQGRD